jgi:Uma2 family endonuclease
MVLDKQKLTLADYDVFIAQPENAGRIFELIDGEIVEKMPSFTPSRVAANLVFLIRTYLIGQPIGYLTGADGGYRMPDGQLYIPDVGFILIAHLPAIPDREVPVPPDLAIEVKSPTDKRRDMRRKAEAYLAAGTPLVWLVFPEDQVVEVYRRDEDVVVLGLDETLNGDDVLPGLLIPVALLFAA